MQTFKRAALYSFLSLALGFVLAESVVLYAVLIGESECSGETWLNRALCGDSGYTVFAACLGIAAVLVVGGHVLIRRRGRPTSR